MDLVSYADLVVELVNTQHPAEDSLKDLETLRELLTIRPHLTGRLTGRDLDAFRQLRTNFRAIFEAAAAGDYALAADGINNLLILYPIHPALSNHGDSPWHLHLTEDGSITDRYAAGASMGLAMVIGERGFASLGICDCPGCYNIYFHNESDSSQRYCSDGCTERDGGQ